MDILEAQQIMLDRLVNQWGGATAILVLPNEAEPEPSTAYARANWVPVTDEQATLGGPGVRRFQRRNYLSIRLQTLRDAGITPMSTLRKKVTDIFEGFSSGELWVTEVTPRSQPPDGLFLVVDCDVGFNFHELK